MFYLLNIISIPVVHHIVSMCAFARLLLIAHVNIANRTISSNLILC